MWPSESGSFVTFVLLPANSAQNVTGCFGTFHLSAFTVPSPCVWQSYPHMTGGGGFASAASAEDAHTGLEWGLRPHESAMPRPRRATRAGAGLQASRLLATTLRRPGTLPAARASASPASPGHSRVVFQAGRQNCPPTEGARPPADLACRGVRTCRSPWVTLPQQQASRQPAPTGAVRPHPATPRSVTGTCGRWA